MKQTLLKKLCCIALTAVMAAGACGCKTAVDPAQVEAAQAEVEAAQAEVEAAHAKLDAAQAEAQTAQTIQELSRQLYAAGRIDEYIAALDDNSLMSELLAEFELA